MVHTVWALDVPQPIQDMIDKRLVHEIHTSERKSFRGCRRRWDWIFRSFYYPQVTAKPLEFGVAFHNAMEVLYDPVTWKWDREVLLARAIDVFKKTCKKQLEKFLSDENRQYLEQEAQQDYAERVELGVGMLKYYWSEVAPEYDNGFQPRYVEVEFIVPIQNPADGSFLFCKCSRCKVNYKDIVGEEPPENWDGLVVALAGRIDMLAEDEFGHYWIVDWKTAARLARGDVSGQDRDEFLDLDDQIGSYVMALRRKLNLNVRGFIYVELKKAFPEPPVRNATRRLGRIYSVNKNQPTDYDLYKKTVIENDGDAYAQGLYDDFLNWLQAEGQNFHGRYQIMKTDEELVELERNLYYEAADMIDPKLRIYPASGRFNCGFCAFRQPCLEKNRQGDFQYMLDTLFDRRKKHYWVKELSTDKQGGE